jgi:hypothetical protein
MTPTTDRLSWREPDLQSAQGPEAMHYQIRTDVGRLSNTPCYI